MEEILASIKRVIAEDGRGGLPAARGSRASARSEPEPEPEQDEAPEEDVLELNDPISEGSGLLSSDSAIASRQSLAALAAMRQQNEQAAHANAAGEGALEAIVKDMLRPMLKDWLDQRLPELVEDMVAREIARITGKGL